VLLVTRNVALLKEGLGHFATKNGFEKEKKKDRRKNYYLHLNTARASGKGVQEAQTLQLVEAGEEILGVVGVFFRIIWLISARHVEVK
jgi:hypothetical protein